MSSFPRVGINIVGISSDGDNRLLKAMTNTMKLGLSPGSSVEEFESWFEDISASINVCVQDSVHIGTKMRNRLLNSSIVLHMGNQVTSIVHIKLLLEKISKEVHGLIWSDIMPEDKQNFSSLEKLMQPRVIDALEENIVDCKGTIMYLKLCKQITSSYLDDNLKPIERIYRIWHATYFLRIWRVWICSKENEHTLTENFVSRNMFLCVELNAHALVYLVRHLRINQQSDLFITSKFASQPCEFIFRHLRSMGTANFTKINFTLYELLHMISKIELSNQIIHSHNEIRFPRVELKQKQNLARNILLPSDQEIFETLKRAEQEASENAAKFDIRPENIDITKFDASILKELKRDRKLNPEQEYFCEDSSEEDEFYDDVNVMDQLFYIEAETTNSKSDPGVNQLETSVQADTRADTSSLASSSKTDSNPGVKSSDSEKNPNEKRNFVEIIYPDGTKINVRKSTLVWKLLENNGKLSSDRLKRVQGSSSGIEPKRKKQKTANEPTDPNNEDQILLKATEISIGEWAIFKKTDAAVINYPNPKQFLEDN